MTAIFNPHVEQRPYMLYELVSLSRVDQTFQTPYLKSVHYPQSVLFQFRIYKDFCATSAI